MTPPPVSSLQKESLDEEGTQPGKIVLYVPASAKVTINDKPTKSTGNRRVYLSYLAPGYAYHFRIQLTDSGHLEQRDVVLEAGATQELRFEQAQVAASEKRARREDSLGPRN